MQTPVRNFMFVAMLLLVLPCGSVAQIVKLTRADKQRLLTEKLQVITQTDALPGSIKSAFARAAHTQTFQMANPGELYQVSDAITKEGLPFYRLLFAGRSGDLCILHYEHGGIAHSYILALYHLSRGHANLVWHGSLHGGILNLANLPGVIKGHNYDDGYGLNL